MISTSASNKTAANLAAALERAHYEDDPRRLMALLDEVSSIDFCDVSQKQPRSALLSQTCVGNDPYKWNRHPPKGAVDEIRLHRSANKGMITMNLCMETVIEQKGSRHTHKIDRETTSNTAQ